MSNDILDVIDRFGKQENKITQKVIISPVYNNTCIVTKIERILYSFIIPSTEPGWYRFRPKNNKNAELIGNAEFDEIDSYLKLLPKLRVIMVFKKHKAFYGLPLKGNQFGFDTHNLLPIYLYDDNAADLSRCICRFDGANLWYETIDFSNDPAKTDYLIESINKLRDPKKIRYTGLSLEEKIAYSFKYTYDKKILEENKKTKIQKDVEFAGGKFIKSKERTDHLFITYEVDGEKFNTIVSKDPSHNIITAGICLTDYHTGRAGDEDFDLKSLVSVIREGQRTGQIVRTLNT